MMQMRLWFARSIVALLLLGLSFLVLGSLLQRRICRVLVTDSCSVGLTARVVRLNVVRLEYHLSTPMAVEALSTMLHSGVLVEKLDMFSRRSVRRCTRRGHSCALFGIKPDVFMYFVARNFWHTVLARPVPCKGRRARPVQLFFVNTRGRPRAKRVGRCLRSLLVSSPQIVLACFVCFCWRAYMLAALVEVQAEGEVERHLGRGWERCAKRRQRMFTCSAHQSPPATLGNALFTSENGMPPP